MDLADHLSATETTQAAFAGRIGIGEAHLSLIIHKRRKPSLEVARRIIDASKGDVTFDDLCPKAKRGAR